MATGNKNIIHFVYNDKKRAGVSLDINTGILKISKRFNGNIASLSAMIDGAQISIATVREKYPFRDVEVEDGNSLYRVKNHCIFDSLSVCLCSDSMDKLPKIDGIKAFAKGCLSHAKLDNPNIVIPKQFEEIPPYFIEHSNITSVTITGEIIIQTNAFAFANKLRNVNFGNVMVGIQKNAFIGNYCIEKLYIPLNVYLNTSAFEDMPNLKKVIYDSCFAYKNCSTPFRNVGWGLPNGTQFVFMEHANIAAPIYDFSKIDTITITPGSEVGVYIKEHPEEFKDIKIISLLGHINKNGILLPYSTPDNLEDLNESFHLIHSMDVVPFKRKKTD